jgi:O-antigen/teichoic acid export membrane protein
VRRSLAVNVAANWAALTTTIIVGFLLTPFMLHRLGDAAFGLWVLMASLGGYYGLLDLGTRNAVLRSVARFAAVNDSKALNDAVKTALSFYTVIGGIVLSITCIVAFGFESLFHFPPNLSVAAKAVVVLFGIGIAIEFPLTVFGSILEGLQRFGRVAVIQIVAMVCRSFLIVAALLNGQGVVAVALITVLTNLAAALAKTAAARSAMPALRVRLGWSAHHAVTLGTFGLVTFWISIAQNLRFQSDSMVIGSLMAVESITMFSMASKLAQYYTDGVQALASVFTPEFSHLSARGEEEELRQTLIFANRLSSLVAFPFGCLLFVAGPSLINVWVGPKYADSALLLKILTVPIALYLAQAGTPKALYGIGRPIALAKVLLAEGLANVVLSVALIGSYGLVGVALGTAIPLLITSVLFLPIHVCRTLGLGLRQYLIEAHGIPFVLTVPVAAALVLLDHELAPTSYTAIAGEVLIAFFVYVLTVSLYLTVLQKDRTNRKLFLSISARIFRSQPTRRDKT